jgi:hypothetical protein
MKNNIETNTIDRHQKALTENINMGVSDMLCPADNRKGAPYSKGPLDFYNLFICRIEQADQTPVRLRPDKFR